METASQGDVVVEKEIGDNNAVRYLLTSNRCCVPEVSVCFHGNGALGREYESTNEYF